MHFRPMARYFFNIYNDEETLDEEGLELPDASAALARAVDEVRNFAAESVKSHSHLVMHPRIEVVDADLRLVGTVRFGDVIEVRP